MHEVELIETISFSLSIFILFSQFTYSKVLNVFSSPNRSCFLYEYVFVKRPEKVSVSFIEVHTCYFCITKVKNYDLNKYVTNPASLKSRSLSPASIPAYSHPNLNTSDSGLHHTYQSPHSDYVTRWYFTLICTVKGSNHCGEFAHARSPTRRNWPSSSDW